MCVQLCATFLFGLQGQITAAKLKSQKMKKIRALF